MKRNVVHLIPFDGIGGVESAAKSAHGLCMRDVSISTLFIFSKNLNETRIGPAERLSTFFKVALSLKTSDADLLIISLWRSVIVALIARLLGCRIPMVLFLHNSKDSHFVDFFFTRLMVHFSIAIWADSYATLNERLSLPKHVKTRVISYITRHIPTPPPRDDQPGPNFIFWGRLADQKNPIRMVDFFEICFRQRSSSTLDIIGPDGGQLSKLKEKVESSPAKNNIRIHGPKDFTEIRTIAQSASFFLQLSRYEGMSLSVIEAMQLGLVPVVSPVGEIQNYTKNEMNSLWVGREEGELQRAARAVFKSIDEPSCWHGLQKNALSTWNDQKVYAEDVILAAIDLLDGSISQ